MTSEGGATDGEGWFAGDSHRFPLRVYWEDTDAGGIVYHANYLRFFERARSDLLTCLGIRQQVLLQEAGLAFAVTGMALRFRRPAKLEDRLQVATRLTALGGASMTLEQLCLRGAEGDGDSEGERLVEAEVRAALIDRGGRPRRLPDHISAAFGPVAATLSPKSSRISDTQHTLGRGHGN
ncbi:tol-pal system-associated acyl-CoA thioesterase [Marinibaculum pumilum]|uniref:Tol-pal system-associated acyl-CoA thioesterase n=1 Tax=Marinibaculum pumilum TaxID=1766165 RepID=A0ABV7L6R6_9PROT